MSHLKPIILLEATKNRAPNPSRWNDIGIKSSRSVPFLASGGLQHRRSSQKHQQQGGSGDSDSTSDSDDQAVVRLGNAAYGYWRDVGSSRGIRKGSQRSSTAWAIMKELEEEHRQNKDGRYRKSLDLPNPYSVPGTPIFVNSDDWDVQPTISPVEIKPGKGMLPGWAVDDDEIILIRSSTRGPDGKRRGLLSLLPHGRSSMGSVYSTDDQYLIDMPLLNYGPEKSKGRISANPLKNTLQGIGPGGVSYQNHTFVVKLKNRTNVTTLDRDSRYPVFKKRAARQERPTPNYIAEQPYRTPSMNPNLNAKGQPYSINGERDWSTNLCTVCEENLAPLCLATACPSVVYGQNKARMEHLRTLNAPLDEDDRPVFSTDCLKYASLSLLCMAWPLQKSTRKSIRNRYDIQGGFWGDLGTVLFCSGFALAQEGREIELEERALLEEEFEAANNN